MIHFPFFVIFGCIFLLDRISLCYIWVCVLYTEFYALYANYTILLCSILYRVSWIGRAYGLRTMCLLILIIIGFVRSGWQSNECLVYAYEMGAALQGLKQSNEKRPAFWVLVDLGLAPSLDSRLIRYTQLSKYYLITALWIIRQFLWFDFPVLYSLTLII